MYCFMGFIFYLVLFFRRKKQGCATLCRVMSLLMPLIQLTSHNEQMSQLELSSYRVILTRLSLYKKLAAQVRHY